MSLPRSPPDATLTATGTSTLPISSSTPCAPNSVRVTENASETDTSRTLTLPEVEPHDESDTPAVTEVPLSTNVSSIRHAHHTNEGFGNSTRLPKLNLPQFSGDPLAWQTFWDSFEAAIHLNPCKLNRSPEIQLLEGPITG